MDRRDDKALQSRWSQKVEGFRGTGFRVQDSGFMVEGLGLRGLGFRDVAYSCRNRAATG